MRIPSYKIENPYQSVETTSNNECFNLCIQDPKCLYAQKVAEYGTNCHLSDTVINSGIILNNTESVAIKSKSL